MGVSPTQYVAIRARVADAVAMTIVPLGCIATIPTEMATRPTIYARHNSAHVANVAAIGNVLTDYIATTPPSLTLTKSSKFLMRTTAEHR